MTAFDGGIGRTDAMTLASALLHFVWQGALVAALLEAVNSLLRRAQARARYSAACGALLLMLALPVATVRILTSRPDPASTAPSPRIAATAAPRAFAGTALAVPLPSSDALARLAPWIVLVWMAGVGLLSLRAAGGWVVAGRLARHGTRPVPPAWEARARELARRLSIRRPVALLESLRVEVPSAIGILRPVVLLPAGLATGLTPDQLDALLAHELAHVRRRDFLVNLLQVAAETLLFYHPAVWWVSHRIRVERENVCDDFAVEATGNAGRYARALVELEERRLSDASSSPRLAVALYGNAPLRERIARLLPSSPASERRSTARPVAAILAHGGALAASAGSTLVEPAPAFLGASTAQSAPAPTPVPAPAAAPAPKAAPPAAAAPRAKSSQRGRLTPDQLVAFRIHGVTPEFIDAIEALGFPKLSPDDLIALRVHDVTPERIRQMKELFANVSLDDCVAFQVHGVTPEYVREIRSFGLTGLSADDAVAFRVHGVTPQYVREIRALGYSDIDADELVAFRVHGITPAYIRSMNESAGGRLSSDDLIENRIFGKEDEEENP